MENSKDIDENKNIDKMFDCGKTDYKYMSDLEEFDQVLSKYRENQVSDHNILQLNTKKSNSIETFVEISINIAENANEAKSFQATYEEYLSNNTKHICDEIHLQNIKTESLDDNVVVSEDSLEILESEHSVDLDALSLASNNIFTNLDIPNEDRNINIEIDTDVNVMVDSLDVLNNANNFQKVSTYFHDRDNFEDDFSHNLSNNTNFDVNNNSDGSFHSSDFEFITEEEAQMDGLIIHFRRNGNEYISNDSNNENFIEMYLPRPNDDFSYRENHMVPEGDEFYNLFRGIYAPAMVPDIFLENKSVISSQCMSVEKDTIGFDLRILNKDAVIVDEEHQEEAKETAKKILETYGSDKRRRSRRLL